MELKKAQEAARVAKEAAKASVQVSYNLGVEETEIHLAEELAEVFKDYCPKVWAEALNLARVPTTWEWRKAKNVYYPPDIRAMPIALPPSAAPTSIVPKQPPTT